MASENDPEAIALQIENLKNTVNTMIKQEIANTSDELNMDVQIKNETEMHEEILSHENDNPFKDVQLEIKQEITMTFERDDSDSQSDEGFKKIEIKSHSKDGISTTPKVEAVEMAMKVKEEEMAISDSLVSYDYPNFDDTRSMDSNEATALSRVEACLQDEPSIKSENDDDKQREGYKKLGVKQESEMMVTETHLISNKLINTTSTITHPHDGIIESKTTSTLVMEILPMTNSGNITLTKICNPEEILPTTCDSNEFKMDCDDTFQLNSITGNVLSLEQEAYGLLKAKRKKYPTKKIYSCSKCVKTYTQNSELARHLRVHDTIEKRAMGVIKSRKTREKNRQKRIKLEEREFQQTKKELVVKNDAEDKVKKEGYECTCGKVFQRRTRMETCLRSHNIYSDTKMFPCLTCRKRFKDKEELALHRKRLHSKRFPCKFCPTDYLTRKELFKHLQVHQKVQLMEYKVISEVVQGKQKLKCFICSKTCTEISDLKTHVMEDHKEPYSCPRCQAAFPKIIDLGNHTKSFHPEVEGQSILNALEAFSKLVQAWKCEECGLQFHEADKLAMHQIEQHSPDLKRDPQFKCEDCHRVFITKNGLASHRRVHHNTEEAELVDATEPGVMCVECRKICKDMNALNSHMRFHSPDRKFPCKFCDFRFATPEKRKAHAEMHTGDMKYVCYICEYQCSSENRLNQHKVSAKHSNMKEYLLTIKPLGEQEQSTSKQEIVKDVDAKKIGVKKKKKEQNKETKKEKDSLDSDNVGVSCDVCGEVFPNESAMLEHKQTHPFIEFPNDDKPSRIFFK